MGIICSWISSFYSNNAYSPVIDNTEETKPSTEMMSLKLKKEAAKKMTEKLIEEYNKIPNPKDWIMVTSCSSSGMLKMEKNTPEYLIKLYEWFKQLKGVNYLYIKIIVQQKNENYEFNKLKDFDNSIEKEEITKNENIVIVMEKWFREFFSHKKDRLYTILIFLNNRENNNVHYEKLIRITAWIVAIPRTKKRQKEKMWLDVKIFIYSGGEFAIIQDYFYIGEPLKTFSIDFK